MQQKEEVTYEFKAVHAKGSCSCSCHGSVSVAYQPAAETEVKLLKITPESFKKLG